MNESGYARFVRTKVEPFSVPLLILGLLLLVGELFFAIKFGFTSFPSLLCVVLGIAVCVVAMHSIGAKEKYLRNGHQQ